MEAIEQIFKPLNEGKHFIIVNGRSFQDITINNANRLILLNENIREVALLKGFIMIEYSKAEGLIVDLSDLNKGEAEDVNKVVTDYGLNNNRNNDNEFTGIIRGLIKLAQAAKYPTFRDGKPMRFLIIIKFAEDLMPNLQAGTHTEDQVIAIELCTVLSRSLALRKNGSYILIREEREGTLDKLLAKNIPMLRISQPDENEKRKILTALKLKYSEAKYESALDDQVVLNSSKNSPNRILDSIFLCSAKSKTEITSKILFAAKQDDIVARSERTLEPVDYERIKGVKLAGRNIERVMQILLLIITAVRYGQSTIRNLLLAGAPSTGKTDMVISAAKEAGILSCFLNPPKSSLVGESERLTRVATSLIKELGGVFILDEVEKIFPMNSGTTNLDSGVSDYILGHLQFMLSDSSLAGKAAFFATTNNPHKISEAMRSRWLILPSLQALKEDYPQIISNICYTVDSNSRINILEKDYVEAAERFYSKGCSPREIKESLITSKAIIKGTLGPEHIVFSSFNVRESNKRLTYNYCDLLAISMCSYLSFLPWFDINTLTPDLSYPFPDYIQDILTADGYIDNSKLNASIRSLEAYANV